MAQLLKESMLKINDIPFNIDLLMPSLVQLKAIKQVKSLDIFEPSSKNYHSEGLFSTEIFGKSGAELRNQTFAYIDIKVEIFHPVVFKALGELRELYHDIMSQKKYVLWDDKLKDFEPSNPIDGQTGMAYFLKYWKQIQFEERPSTKREFNIKLVKKYQNQELLRYILVLPAGLRDYEINENGKPEEGEVNTFYRKLINLSNLISTDLYKLNPESVDQSRYTLQTTMVEIYNYFRSLLEGKSKFINAKWAARRVFNSTRNVISTFNNEANHADDPTSLKFNQTAIGLYQHIKAIVPLSLYQLRETYLTKVFPGPNTPAFLVNKKTLKKEAIAIKPEHYDDWMSNEGLINVINRFAERDLRHEVLTIDNHYLGLIYKGPDDTFKFLQDIDDLPDPSYKQYVTPITFCELLYISVYKDADKIPGVFTRYPVINYGGIYPSYTHLKTTEPFEVREELGDQWERTGKIATAFPMVDENFFDTMAPHQSHLARLVADFDGDVCSWTALITEEAQTEIKNKLNSPDYYVDANGKMYFSAETDILNYVLGYLTK